MGEPLIYIDPQKARDLDRNLTLQKYKEKVPPTNEKNLTLWMPAFFRIRNYTFEESYRI